MGYENCLFINVTKSKAATFVSMILLSLGILGLLAVLFLHHSSDEVPFYLVTSYMTLLVIASVLSLCATLTRCRVIVFFSVLLCMSTFMFWLTLTVPVLLSSGHDHTHSFCLGNYCGESHWLLPRDWKGSVEDVSIDSFQKDRSVTDAGADFYLYEMNESSTNASKTGPKEALLYDNLYHPTAKNIIERKALIQLNKANSMILAVVYAVLFCCLLTILNINLVSIMCTNCGYLPRPPVCLQNCSKDCGDISCPRQPSRRPRKIYRLQTRLDKRRPRGSKADCQQKAEFGHNSFIQSVLKTLNKNQKQNANYQILEV